MVVEQPAGPALVGGGPGGRRAQQTVVLEEIEESKAFYEVRVVCPLQTCCCRPSRIKNGPPVSCPWIGV